MATKEKEADLSGLDEFAKNEADDNVVGLGDAAATAVSHIGDPSQHALEGMENLNKVKFVGMSMDSLDDLPKIGDEVTFLVRTRCVGTGEEEMRDGHVRHFAKMDVQSVIPQ